MSVSLFLTRVGVVSCQIFGSFHVELIYFLYMVMMNMGHYSSSSTVNEVLYGQGIEDFKLLMSIRIVFR